MVGVLFRTEKDPSLLLSYKTGGWRYSKTGLVATLELWCSPFVSLEKNSARLSFVSFLLYSPFKKLQTNPAEFSAS